MSDQCGYIHPNGARCSGTLGHPGGHVYHCASRRCPGLHYPASVRAHRGCAVVPAGDELEAQLTTCLAEELGRHGVVGQVGRGPGGVLITARWPGSYDRSIVVLCLERTVLALQYRRNGADIAPDLSHEDLQRLVRGADWPSWIPERVAEALRNIELPAVIGGGMPSASEKVAQEARQVRTTFRRLRDDLGEMPATIDFQPWPATIAEEDRRRFDELELRVLIGAALRHPGAREARLDLQRLRQDLAGLAAAMDAEEALPMDLAVD